MTRRRQPQHEASDAEEERTRERARDRERRERSNSGTRQRRVNQGGRSFTFRQYQPPPPPSPPPLQGKLCYSLYHLSHPDVPFQTALSIHHRDLLLVRPVNFVDKLSEDVPGGGFVTRTRRVWRGGWKQVSHICVTHANEPHHSHRPSRRGCRTETYSNRSKSAEPAG